MARARATRRNGENAVRTKSSSRGRSRRSGSNEVLKEQDINSPVRLRRARPEESGGSAAAAVFEDAKKERIAPPDDATRKRSASISERSATKRRNATATVSASLRSAVVTSQTTTTTTTLHAGSAVTSPAAASLATASVKATRSTADNTARSKVAAVSRKSSLNDVSCTESDDDGPPLRRFQPIRAVKLEPASGFSLSSGWTGAMTIGGEDVGVKEDPSSRRGSSSTTTTTTKQRTKEALVTLRRDRMWPTTKSISRSNSRSSSISSSNASGSRSSISSSKNSQSYRHSKSRRKTGGPLTGSVLSNGLHGATIPGQHQRRTKVAANTCVLTQSAQQKELQQAVGKATAVVVPEPWVVAPFRGTKVDFSQCCRVSTAQRTLCELMDECRRQKVTLRLAEEEVYIVEKILSHEATKPQMRFLVRWKDWSPKYDTWEPEANLVVSSANCLLLAEYFDRRKEARLSHGYLVKYLRATVLLDEPTDLLLLATLAGHELDPEHGPPLPYRKLRREMQQRIRLNLAFERQATLLKAFGGRLGKFTAFAKKRARGLDENLCWEALIAKLEPGAQISIENVCDTESLPREFKYVTDYVVSPNVRYMAPTRSCRCTEAGCFGKECCGVHAGRYRGYIRGQLARTCGQVPLYECNSACRCGPQCENRLIQKGVQLQLTIFKTTSRGWGVRAEQRIARGTFVAEYLGELMTSAEAVARHAVNFSYLFDLQPYRDRPVENTVDAALYGNVSRFFNHSCDPNIAISYAYIENHYPGAPRLAFFARRDIARHEELTFNYCMQTTGTVGTLTKVECKCGSPKCRKYLF